MSSFHIVKESKINDTYNSQNIKNKFDIQNNIIKEEFIGNIDLDNLDWNIGVIFGNSGTGKSSIAKELFGDYFINFNYTNKAIIDDIPCENLDEIIKCFNSVGFSSPPSWLKPYSVLSNGEKMRVDLCYSLLSKNDIIIFDEFTSVVDRDVAKIGSLALQKNIRKNNKKFIAVSCHEDIIEWLEPDWIFNTNNMEFKRIPRGELCRPKIEISIRQCSRELWKYFEKYHYLNNKLGKQSQNYCLFANNKLAGFIGIVHFPHKIKNFKRVHRLVVLPDYQGIGLGKILIEEVGKFYIDKKFRYIITTSQPGLIYYFNKSKNWILKGQGRLKLHNGKKMISSAGRYTTSWEFINKEII